MNTLGGQSRPVAPRSDVSLSFEQAVRAGNYTARHFFSQCGVGVGKVALASLLADELSRSQASAAQSTQAARATHFAPRAKRVIHLFMAGAPSQLDLFDYKPKLAELEGKPLPKSVVGDQRYAFIRSDAGVLGPQFKFAKQGQSGTEISEALPYLAQVVDVDCPDPARLPYRTIQIIGPFGQ